MSGAAERELEERLREAAALGDVEEVRRLLGAGADINSRNEINGWTCLHWACKRNHAQVVSCLLAAGANRQILTARGELAAELTVKADIRKMLGEEEMECQGVKDLNLPLVVNYLSQLPFPYAHTEESIRGSLVEPKLESSSLCFASPATQPDSAGTPTSCSSPEDFPAVAAPPSPVGQPSSPPSPCLHPGPSLCLPHSTSPCLPAAAPPHPSSLPLAPAAAFQPLFFTGTFPCNMQELVLKVRVQNLRDSDFIEIELDRQELTYRDLLRVSCCELGVNPEQVEKIRKLPNTLVRKDKDVARLQDFQELELVLLRSTTSPLTGRACYSSSASRLTY
ncbi:ankyrin repeat domain-containing protein 40-like isoform X1 [Indicator indicator]|uniref:ankyrin repeat domain-containing protein 40-like isoform X1 n=1 Tax=Indicator indicator TaxID=1002788 RepID=UPI0023DF6C02|nr:ankyrin repeat domain-containing protein 40-like isoform X1 [Indicator indicator]